MPQPHNVTELLQIGDERSIERLFPIVYDELHSIASALFRGEFRASHTLQPTALVHEAYLRLVGDSDGVTWQNRAHFFGIAARSMRQILVNHAVARRAEKRGGGQTILALDDAVGYLQTQNLEILSLHNALEHLADLDPRQAQIVELRFFGGLTIEETAEVLRLSTATVKRDWEMARAWLFRELMN